MNEHPYQRQSWLGAIALVVCIIIWLSLLMPTIQDGHRTSDSLACQNQIKQLVMAAVEFESTSNGILSINRRLPPRLVELGSMVRG